LTIRNRPVVSIIIPAYNIAPYIRQAVESVLCQSVVDLEVIVVDDGSTDTTVKELENLGDDRLHIVRQKHMGLADARNAGIKKACAPYIGFLDGDDLWKPNKVEQHIKFLERHPEIDLTFSLSVVMDEKGREIQWITKPFGFLSFKDLFLENPVCNAVLRRKALERAGPFDPALAASEDVDMWLRVARLRPNNIYCIPELLSLYRRRPGQLTSDWRRMELAWQQICEKMRQLSPIEVQSLERQANFNRYRYFAILAYEEKRCSEFIRLLSIRIQHAPQNVLFRSRAWLQFGIYFLGLILPAPIQRSIKRAGFRYNRWLFARMEKNWRKNDSKFPSSSASMKSDLQIKNRIPEENFEDMHDFRC